MANRYDMGDLVRVTSTWTDPLNGDAAIDPTTVYLAVQEPSGKTITYTYNVDVEVVRSSTGVYYSDISLGSAGPWYYRWYSTGTAQAAEETKIIADRPQAI